MFPLIQMANEQGWQHCAASSNCCIFIAENSTRSGSAFSMLRVEQEVNKKRACPNTQQSNFEPAGSPPWHESTLWVHSTHQEGMNSKMNWEI